MLHSSNLKFYHVGFCRFSLDLHKTGFPRRCTLVPIVGILLRLFQFGRQLAIMLLKLGNVIICIHQCGGWTSFASTNHHFRSMERQRLVPTERLGQLLERRSFFSRRCSRGQLERRVVCRGGGGGTLLETPNCGLQLAHQVFLARLW